MSRAVRVEWEGAFYHVMARGVARLPTFLDDEDRRIFLRKLGRLVERGVLEVHAYCLMPNHYHLLLRTPQAGLARWMRHVNGDYVRTFNYRHRRVGHLWQGRYKAILVEEARYLKECSRYIHLNPNRAKITRPAERYPWSSYRNYVGGPKAVPWVETRMVLGEFGGDRSKYRAYVEAGKGEKPVSPFERAVAGVALGSEAFISRVRTWASRRKGDPGEQPSLRSLVRNGKAPPEKVEAAIDAVFPEVGPARRVRLKLYALRLHSGLGPVEIGRRHGRRHSTVRMAVRDLEAKARRDASLASRMKQVSARMK